MRSIFINSWKKDNNKMKKDKKFEKWYLFDIYTLDNDVTVILNVMIILTYSAYISFPDSYSGNYYMKIL